MQTRRAPASEAAVDVEAFGVLCDQATAWPLPGGGSTADRLRLLSEVAEDDLVVGRLVEAHADAVAITRELGPGMVGPGQRWGVWAAGPPDSLRAACVNGGWRITGTKGWCSGATILTHSLVDAATEKGQQLFAVALASEGVVPCAADWVGAGMARSDTRSVSFDAVEGIPVGAPGSYLSRAGFWAGAIGVAACWHGGTVTVARPLLDKARVGNDPHLLTHLGAVHVALEENRAVLERSAGIVDRAPCGDHAVLARSVRTTIERNAMAVIDRVGRALGPAPLARDLHHATTVADLTVYVRQHHAERDLEELGRDLINNAGARCPS
jgi:alkylation response protein AidB-like acyl-CoA dehydrogenase